MNMPFEHVEDSPFKTKPETALDAVMLKELWALHQTSHKPLVRLSAGLRLFLEA